MPYVEHKALKPIMVVVDQHGHCVHTNIKHTPSTRGNSHYTQPHLPISPGFGSQAVRMCWVISGAPCVRNQAQHCLLPGCILHMCSTWLCCKMGKGANNYTTLIHNNTWALRNTHWTVHACIHLFTAAIASAT